PEWATEFARELKLVDGRHKVVNGLGEFFFEIRADRESGVIDMLAGPDEEALQLFPTRVVPLGDGGSAFTFTTFQAPGQPDDQLRGVRLAVRQVNAQGGLWDGRKVTVFAADDKGDASNAKVVASRVISKKIHFVIGPYNSSVGIANLALYRKYRVLPLWMTSRDETAGAGATVQPMNTQIAPVEDAYVTRSGARRVAMPVDDRPNGAFREGRGDR